MTNPTTSGDILAWLDTAIRRRENTARAVGWDSIRSSDYGWGTKYLTLRRPDQSTNTPALEVGLADHIALNDPAAVLRRCAADRKLIAAHGPWTDEERTLIGVPASDQSCKGWGFNNQEEPMVADYRHCPVLLALAEGYGWTAGA